MAIMMAEISFTEDHRCMSQIAIRKARADDEQMLSDLLAASYAELRGSYDPHGFDDVLSYISRANPKLLASGRFYVAMIDGVAAGCGGWSIEKPGSGEVVEGVGHIRHFGTHPAFLRQGVARRILEHCLSGARNEPITNMMCLSTLPAEGFYRSSGFQRVSIIDVHMGPGLVLPAVEMTLDLSERQARPV
jgi:N-acetylglutamate synthase-like GNAT family acetyltransferase